MNLILIGPPVTGKGTQSIILSKYFNIPHISIGDIFRKNLEDKTILGQQIQLFLEQGTLVPDHITNRMVIEHLEKSNINCGFILDGFPRNLIQSEFLDTELKKKKIVLTKAIYLNSDEEVLKKRILGRIVCPLCGDTYHKENKIPLRYGLCDNDNSILIKRKDDDINIFQKRLSVYQEETFPLVNYYKNKNKLLEIKVDECNSTSINEVTKMILVGLLPDNKKNTNIN